jgi:predicted aspartyl protease
LAFASAEAASGVGGSPCRAILGGGIALENANGLVLVTVRADGFPLKLIVDTGAERTVLTSRASERLGTAPQIQFRRSLRGVAASLTGREVEFKSFTIGGVDVPWRRATVAQNALPPSFGAADGILGNDVLGKFDIELDLPNRRMSLYQTGICRPDWTGAYSEIAIGRSAVNGHLFFPVQLDGRKISATIDTGADRTVLSAATAKAMGITDAALAQDRTGTTRGFGGGVLTSRLHQFDRVTIGGQPIGNPRIVVTDLRLRGIDLILGMDLLSSRRLWLSYSGFRLFLSHPSGAVGSGNRSAQQ